jgi:hypothetical protein
MLELLRFYNRDQIERYAGGSEDKLLELLASCQPKKVSIGSLKNRTSSKILLVSSPDGWVPVTDCVEKIKDSLFQFKFKSGRIIEASHDHLYQKTDETWHYAKDCVIGDKFLSEDGIDQVEYISNRKGSTKVYDLAVNHSNHRYFTNGICSHNTGKSLFLQNLALNWMEAGLKGIYITFELSEELVAMRLDSMITGISSREIFRNLDDVELKIGMAGKKSGRLKIKYMSSQSTVNQIKAYVKELAIQEGFKPDFICLDYLDLIMPSGAKVDVSDVFTKDKLVCEEIRNFAIEIKSLLATASQLNRSAFEEIEFSPSAIAGGISKLNTADTVFGIFTSRMMKERGAIQLQFMKTRNSAGVGQKVDLDFNVNSLRITDSSQSAAANTTITGSNLLNQIKNRTAKSPGNATVTIGGVTENKQDLLKQLMGSIKAKG